VKISPAIIERVLQDRSFWRKLAVELLAESQAGQNEPGYSIARGPALGPIAESRIHAQDPRVTIRGQPGPRPVPMIAEVRTIDPIKRAPVLSQSQARHRVRKMNEARLKAQQSAQDFDLHHPGQDCRDVHPNMSHDDWLDSEEEEEENHPLFRQNMGSARSISRTQTTRE
jgi:hypothetical protein